MASVKLELSLRQYNEIHALADGRGKETRIKKTLLRSLLVDLTRLHNCATFHEVTIEEKAK